MGPTYSASTDGRDGEEVLSYPGVAFGVVKLPTRGQSRLSRIVITPHPAPTHVPVHAAWLYPTLPESPAVAQGDLRLVEIRVRSISSLCPLTSTADEKITNSSTTTSDRRAPCCTSTSPTRPRHRLQSSCDSARRRARTSSANSGPRSVPSGRKTRVFAIPPYRSHLTPFSSQDRMSIHSTTTSVDPSLSRSSPRTLFPSSPHSCFYHTANPYFISHPHLGLTFLLHPTTHTLLKLILHSNLPGEVNFGRSSRCPFVFVPASSSAATPSQSFSTIEHLLASASSPTSADSTPTKRRRESVGSIDDEREQSTRGRGVREHATVGREHERPMSPDRTVDGGDGSIVGKTTG